MERKEHRSGSPGRRSGRGGVCGPGQPQAVVQRTQVMLLAGETWEPDSAQAVLSSFAHQVLPPATTTTTSSPANPPTPPAPGTLALDSITSSANLPQPPSEAPPPPPGQASGQLIFFLCRPSSLRERLSRLREVLQGVREQSRGAPAALVGVIVQPREDEEAGARACLEDLLREVFQAEGAAPVEMHTAIFKPGRPKGALDVKRVGGGTESRREKVGEAWPRAKLRRLACTGPSKPREAYVGSWGWGVLVVSQEDVLCTCSRALLGTSLESWFLRCSSPPAGAPQEGRVGAIARRS